MNRHFRLPAVLLLLATSLPSGVAAQETGTVAGEVHDSTAPGPLPEATVVLMGTGRMAVTDEAGRFEFEDVEPGTHRMTFFHDRLEELGLGGASWEVEVAPGEAADAFLHIPSVEEIARTLCRGEPGVLIGVLRDPDSGRRLAGGAVSARWTTEEGAEASRFVMTDDSGRFALCGLPREQEVVLRSTFSGREGADQPIRLPASGLLVRDVELALTALAPLTGLVADMDTDEPIPGANVRIEGTSRMSITNEEGRFVLEDVPPGRHLLEVQHVAYGTYRDTVRVASGGIGQDVQVRIASDAVPLEGIEITVAALYHGHMAGFESRRAGGVGGEFITRDIVERLESQPLPRMIASRTAGFRVSCSGGSMGRCFLESRRAGPRACAVDYWLDGAYSPGLDPNNISTWEVEAIEAYANPSEVPSRFRSRNYRCGVVVIWTRGGPDSRDRG